MTKYDIVIAELRNGSEKGVSRTKGIQYPVPRIQIRPGELQQHGVTGETE